MFVQDDVVLSPMAVYTQKLVSDTLAPKLHEMVKDIMVRLNVPTELPFML